MIDKNQFTISCRLKNTKSFASSDFGAKNKIRRWFSIILAWVIILMTLIQFSMFSSILGPFLSMLDPGSEKDFAPWAVVAFSFGQIITPPMFGYWCNKRKKCRLPISCGILTIIFGNLIYCYLESFDTSARKWAMVTSRIVVGLGAGIVSVGRTYCASASTAKEQQIAIAGSTAALGLSVIAGPGAQALFAKVGYPGLHIHGFHLHAYNAPAFASIIIFIVLLFLNSTLLLEEYPGIENNAKEITSNKPFDEIALPKYDRFGAWLLVWLWFCTWVALTNFVILGVPFTQSQFDWPLKTAISYNGGLFGVFAMISLIVYTLSAFFAHKCQDRTAVIFGMIFVCLFYIFTFPWPVYASPGDSLDLDLFSDSNNFTLSKNNSRRFMPCQEALNEWCLRTPRIPILLYLLSFTFMAIGFPVANSSLSCLLSKLIGPRKQGIMQGIYVTSGGFARLLGPLTASLIFIRFGPQYAWILTVCLIGCGTIMALVFRKRLVPLNTEPNLKPGEFYRYKSGVLYRL